MDGGPVHGVAKGPHLRSHAVLLTHSWQRAVDRWIEADFRLGRRRELCADLAGVLARFHSPAPLYTQLKADLDHDGQDPEVIRRYLRRRRGSPALTARRGVPDRVAPRTPRGGDLARSAAPPPGLPRLQRI
ncbi:BTAD domain-containing putative transcriptional regulator [Streptomyces spongiicola]|uniref:BTAD domain-containing putative transcriptional regulator n=1 Tax=Streptomyces spongiicola TaxID=1690221 RepID=UPI001FE46E32|nr:BTAD domain-containing putative transcriptional regulator [Streptomyces spongiicola]